MSKKTTDNEEEMSFFRDAMRGVKPLAQKKKAPLEKPVIQPKRRALTPAEPPAPAPLSDFDREEPVDSETHISFAKSGIQHKILRKMRSGQYNVEAILDLHGMRVDEAKEALYQFLLQCQQKCISHVLVIHGKGRHRMSTPILKNKLNNWLRQMDHVLAFCSAAAKDGRSGALYILLKKGR